MISEKKKNQIQNILYISLHVLMITIFISFIIKYYIGFSEYEYIWFCSKIVTIKKMIKDNNKYEKIFYGYNEDGQELKYIDNYLDFLKNAKKEGCPINYKKCGILDTYGNNFCRPENVRCPINDIKYDLNSKSSEYVGNGYSYYRIEDEPNLNLYYKYEVQNKGVIVKWIFSDSQPKYIDEDNFIIDVDAYNEIFNSLDLEEKSVDDIGKILGKGLIQGNIDNDDASELKKILELSDYIKEKINKDENIDYDYSYVNGNEYVKNYMGFKNYQDAKDFEIIDFSIYKERFPDFYAMIFSAFLLSLFIIFAIINVVFLIKDGYVCCLFYISIILYISSFLYLWIYSIDIYINYFKNESIDIAKRIRGDKFIEKFLKEFYEHFEKKSFIIIMITILSFSALLFFSILFIKPILNCINNRKIKLLIREEYFRNNNKRQNLNNNININRPQLTTETIQINTNRKLNENSNQNDNNNKPKIITETINIISKKELVENTNQNENNEHKENNNENNAKNDILNINKQKIDNKIKDNNINNMNTKTIEDNN